MVRNWCVFDDEMVASKKASFSELKKFITETKLEFRPPYASSDRRLPKSFIIVRATNDHDYLNDLTRGSAFWLRKSTRTPPIRAGSGQRKTVDTFGVLW